MSITITEALAEIKTIGKRLTKKQEAIKQVIARQDGLRDPMEKEGGSVLFITTEHQAIADLENRVLQLRRGIAKANNNTTIVLGSMQLSIADWLIWRREVAPYQQQRLNELRALVNSIRTNAQRQGVNMVVAGGTTDKPTDIVVNISEIELAKQIESLEDTLGQLDGQLSLRNATVTIEE